jgi:hypothetical protein
MGILRRIFGSPAQPGRVGAEEGFVDIDLPLTKLDAVHAASRAAGRGSFEQGSVAAVGVQLGAAWEEQSTDEGPVLYWGKGKLTSTGAESDRLVALLALHYGHNSFSERHMLNEVPFQAVCLEGDPRPQPTSNVRMKLFFFPDDEQRYAEMYLNIDTRRQVLELHEKDNEYRLPLLRALTEA